jgi:hypothetical protein
MRIEGRLLGVAAVLLVVSALLIGCKSNPSSTQRETPVAAPAPGPAPAAQSPWRMTFETDPAEPKINKAATIRIRLSNADDTAVTGAKVTASLVMTLMDMGKNEVQLADKGDGVYEGKATFTMSGPWKVVVTANSGGKTGEQKFDVAVKE